MLSTAGARYASVLYTGITTEIAGVCSATSVPSHGTEECFPRFDTERCASPRRHRMLAGNRNMTLLQRFPRPGAQLQVGGGMRLRFVAPVVGRRQPAAMESLADGQRRRRRLLGLFRAIN